MGRLGSQGDSPWEPNETTASIKEEVNPVGIEHQVSGVIGFLGSRIPLTATHNQVKKERKESAQSVPSGWGGTEKRGGCSELGTQEEKLGGPG